MSKKSNRFEAKPEEAQPVEKKRTAMKLTPKLALLLKAVVGAINADPTYFEAVRDAQDSLKERLDSVIEINALTVYLLDREQKAERREKKAALAEENKCLQEQLQANRKAAAALVTPKKDRVD